MKEEEEEVEEELEEEQVEEALKENGFRRLACRDVEIYGNSNVFRSLFGGKSS